MKDQTFFRSLVTVTGICTALTVAHLLYTVYAYQHCSILYFIAEELW